MISSLLLLKFSTLILGKWMNGEALSTWMMPGALLAEEAKKWVKGHVAN